MRESINPRLEVRNDFSKDGDLGWRAMALCADEDPDLFFPASEDVKTVADKSKVNDAKAICNQCPVQPRCLQEALDKDVGFGVWGGATSMERRRLKDRRQYSR